MNINKKKSSWFRLGILTITLILLIGLYFTIMSWQIISVWKTSHGQRSDCLIILGAGVWDGKPSPAMQERLDVALQAYKDKLANYIIASGGKGKDEILSEAEVMKTYLDEKGVPYIAVILEDQSNNTIENLQNSKKIMDARHYKTAIIVTHGYHALRASLIAKSMGISHTVQPVQVRPINLTYYVLRECTGIAFFEGSYFIRKIMFAKK
jgi:uncharacterized SAM-binding protein YcdF (DUF218 family)